MGDGLPEKLYTAWRSSQADPTAFPSWGNVEAETRVAWEAVAIAARGYMAEQFVFSLDTAERMHTPDGAKSMADMLRARWSR